jgi:hypothetical protein
LTHPPSHHVAADTPPVRAAASDSFQPALVAFARYGPSQPPELPGDEATSAFTVRCNLVCCAYSFLSMLSEGFAILLSLHGASQATRLESPSLGRTFTDWLMCPWLDTPITPVRQSVALLMLFALQSPGRRCGYTTSRRSVAVQFALFLRCKFGSDGQRCWDAMGN